jgi:hypothetical protein
MTTKYCLDNYRTYCTDMTNKKIKESNRKNTNVLYFSNFALKFEICRVVYSA